MLPNLSNYGPFLPLVKTGYQEVHTSDITPENYHNYFNGLLNIMRDGIESPEVQGFKIGIHLADKNFIKLVLVDAWFNLIFWSFPIQVGDPITVKYLFDTMLTEGSQHAITKDTITKYLNMLIQDHYDLDFILLNNRVDDILSKFKYIEEFSMFLMNPLNFADTLDLAKIDPAFANSLHADFSNVNMNDVISTGMDYAKLQIQSIMTHDHCLRDSFTAKEAIKPAQFKEMSVNIGTKPDGQGGIFPYIINNSFMNGGVFTPESYFIDSSVGRTAQILAKVNVGTSGAFARLLETNNLDTFFHIDKNYSCDTKNFIKVQIEDDKWLSLFDKRYYRFTPDGPEFLLRKKDHELIGKTLYFRSPMTCASYARGEGICRRCYGDLYLTNFDINPGKIAAEILTSQLTQMLLSAKHLLASNIVKMVWNPEFSNIFDIDVNAIYINESRNVNNMYLMLDSNAIDIAEEDEDEGLDDDEEGLDTITIGPCVTCEYVTSFDILYPDKTRVTFHTQNYDDIFLSEELNKLLYNPKIKRSGGVYMIPLNALKTLSNIFMMKLQNKELQQTLGKVKHILSRNRDTSSYDKDTIINALISVNNEGKLWVNSVHLEVIVANQMRDACNILEKPDWTIPDVPYKILTVNSSLTNSASITTSLEFQRIGQCLISPLSSKKRKPSIYDLFFMEHPQDFVVDKSMISEADYEDYFDNE